jgi:hypothetical protein
LTGSGEALTDAALLLVAAVLELGLAPVVAVPVAVCGCVSANPAHDGVCHVSRTTRLAIAPALSVLGGFGAYLPGRGPGAGALAGRVAPEVVLLTLVDRVRIAAAARHKRRRHDGGQEGREGEDGGEAHVVMCRCDEC